MTENKNIKYKLETLASFWPEDLDYPQFEVAYEIESGEESFGTVCCIDLAEQALKRITELERLVEKYKCHIVELHDELSGYEELCDIIIAQDDLDVDSEAFGRLGLKILGKAQDKLGLVDRVRMRELNK